MPAQVVENVKTGYKQGVEADEAILSQMEERAEATEKGEADLGLGRLERQENVEREWARGVKGLEGLMSTLPETVARKERAEKAESYIGKTDKR